MKGKVAIIWVHYYTPELLHQSVNAVEAQLRESGIASEFIVVDNGGMDGVPANVRTIKPTENVGYAGGVNRGVASTDARNIVIMNPDVLAMPGCIPTLIASLERFDIVGPSLFLDHRCIFELPPTEQHDFVSTCIAELGRHHSRWTYWARRRWRKHARRHWETISNLRTSNLSGAIMAFTRETFDAVGKWDDRYKLYFEETDWLRCAQKVGRKSSLIPSARAIHLYAQSSRKQPRAVEWFAESRKLYESKHFSTVQRQILGLIRKRPGNVKVRTRDKLEAAEDAAWVELSITPCGYPAARCRLNEPRLDTAEISRVVSRRFHDDACWLRWVDRHGRELATTSGSSMR